VRLLPASALLLLAACAGAPLPAPAPADPAAACQQAQARLHPLIGQPYEAVAEQLAGLGQALRLVEPDMMVTQDFVPERLTVELDAERRIRRVACG